MALYRCWGGGNSNVACTEVASGSTAYPFTATEKGTYICYYGCRSRKNVTISTTGTEIVNQAMYKFINSLNNTYIYSGMLVATLDVGDTVSIVSEYNAIDDTNYHVYKIDE